MRRSCGEKDVVFPCREAAHRGGPRENEQSRRAHKIRESEAWEVLGTPPRPLQGASGGGAGAGGGADEKRKARMNARASLPTLLHLAPRAVHG